MEEIQINGEKIQYKIIKSKIKNLYIHIKNGEVIVKIPTRISKKKAKEFVEKKAEWILEKVKEQQKQTQKEEKIEEQDIQRLAKIVEEQIKKYSEKLQIKPNKVRIRNINYAWGSCSSRKNITINSKLAKKKEKVIEYVVLHEMCHLIHMNHSKEFWKLIENNMPEYKKYKNILNGK